MKEVHSNVYNPENNPKWKVHKKEHKITRHIQNALVTEFVPTSTRNPDTSWRIFKVVWCNWDTPWGVSYISWHVVAPTTNKELSLMLDMYMQGIETGVTSVDNKVPKELMPVINELTKYVTQAEESAVESYKDQVYNS